MVELGLVAVLLVGLVATPWILAIAPWDVTFGTGVTLMALGLVVGVPASLVYHVRLWRALQPARGWWLRPTALHGRLGDGQKAPVLRWFRVGAAMFGVAILGCVLVAVGAVRGR
jgi:hypothetical protein